MLTLFLSSPFEPPLLKPQLSSAGLLRLFRGWNEEVSQCNPHRGKRPGEDLERKSTGALRGPPGARGAEEPEAGKKGEG